MRRLWLVCPFVVLVLYVCTSTAPTFLLKREIKRVESRDIKHTHIFGYKSRSLVTFESMETLESRTHFALLEVSFLTPRRNFSAVGFIFPHFRSRERKGCVRATWCDLVLMVLDELMVLDKWPIGSQVYVFHPGQINVIHPGQIYCNAIVIDIRCSGMWREVKVHYQGWPCEYDEWILERSSRLDIRTKNDEIDVVP